MLRSHLVVLVLTAVCVSGRGAAWVSDEELVLRGTLSYDIHPGIAERWARRSFFFRVTLCGDKAVFHTATEDGKKYQEVVFDNGSAYTVLGVQVADKERVAAEVSYRFVPRDDGSMINYLWLAYGSGPYFDARTTNRLHPIWILDDPYLAKTGYTVESLWDRSPDERVPRRVVYLNDGYARTGRRIWKWPVPYDQGFTNALYEVTASTNVLGRFVPLAFSFTRYGVEPVGTGGHTLSIITAVEARVTGLEHRRREAGEPRPAFKGVADVADYRFENSNPALPVLAYKTTNGTWLELRGDGAKELRAKYDREVGMRKDLEQLKRRASRSWTTKRNAIRFTIGALVCLGVLLVMRHSRRRL